MTVPKALAFDRSALAEVLGAPMAGQRAPNLVPFNVGQGAVKTYVLEVNGPTTVGEAADRFAALVHGTDLQWGPTEDPSILLAWSEGTALFTDVLDPRFWIIHTASAVSRVASVLTKAIWLSRDVDRCWFSQSFLRHLQSRGEPRWFKSFFSGERLLPQDGVPARRLKVQLEGDDADWLLDLLLENERSKHATSLAAIATRIREATLGAVDEFATSSGRFTARGDSFEMHAGFVGQAVREYRSQVESVERAYGLKFEGSSQQGLSVEGRTIAISFGRPVTDMNRFITELFSCREPFRLWGVPAVAGDGWYEVEVVDLHVGFHLRMDVWPGGIRAYLPAGACGNTVFRLLTNLQHHYDATIDDRFALEAV